MVKPTRKCFIDFETRSPVDLKVHGAFVYASHPDTEVMCTAYAFDYEDPRIVCWSKIADEVENHVLEGGTVVAHNAAFELAMWNLCGAHKYSWAPLKVEQADCTLARAYAMGLPGALQNCAAALGLDAQKDMSGHRLMLKLSKPQSIDANGEHVWWPEHENEIARLHAYCLQDLRVTQQVDKRLLQLSPKERRIWCLDQQINNRGVHCDVQSAEKASKIIEQEKDRLNAEMRKVTGNEVATFTANTQLKNWLNQQGVETDGVAKADVQRLLSRSDLSLPIREALQIRQEGAKSSTAKLTAFVARADIDSRIRGIFQYHGATTGRWAGRDIQPHNFPREKYDPAFFNSLDDVELLRLFYGSPTTTISRALRGFLTASPNHTLYAADFSAIEARVVAWLAGETDTLLLFERNQDVYVHAAGQIYGVPSDAVTKEQRQIGKVAILALGYQGGVNAFQAMAKGYGISLSPVAKDLWDRAPYERRDKARWGWDQRGKSSGIDKREWAAAELIKLAWREANPNIVSYWRSVEEAACRAVSKPGDVIACGNVAFKVSGSFLFCRLPSGRALCYPYPKIKPTKTPWGEERPMLRYKTEDSTTRKWVETAAYGGLLVENITQAVARDILAEAMLRVDGVCLPVVLHVHDELVCEVSVVKCAYSLRDFEKLVEEVPTWATGLPLKAEGWCGRRYRK